MRVEELLKASAKRVGAKVAIVVGRRHHSYGDLERKSARLASALIGRGVARGNRIALFMDNTFEAVVSTFAILKVGAVVTPIDAKTDAETLAVLLERSGAVGIVTEARLATTAATAMVRVPGVKLVVLAGGDRAPSQGSCLGFEDIVGRISPVTEMLPRGEPGDAAILLQPANGGDPETLTHDDLVAAASSAELREDTVVITAVAISSHYGLYQLLTAIRVGATQVLQNTSAFRETVFNSADQLQAEAKLALAG
jgi:acyl-CoA synthetase (AMP-forming)/AMP-acid ligase II